MRWKRRDHFLNRKTLTKKQYDTDVLLAPQRAVNDVFWLRVGHQFEVGDLFFSAAARNESYDERTMFQKGVL